MGFSIGIIGAGKMGGSLAQGLVRKGLVKPEDVILSVGTEQHRAELEASSHMRTVTDNTLLVREADTIVLAVKPRAAGSVLEGIGGPLGSKKLLISMVAGLNCLALESNLAKGAKVVRAMPNLAISIGEGMTAVAGGHAVQTADIEKARAIFGAVGRAVVVDEKLMDAVTGLSGSGIAYIYVVIEALASAGIELGLGAAAATELAAQTVKGAGAMVLSTGSHPAVLKDQVTTPGGTTIAGLMELEKGGIRTALADAVRASAKRSAELNK